MIEKDPANWPAATWLLAIGMATIGGLINWWHRVKTGNARMFNFIELVGEIFTSGFVGVGCYMLLESMGQAPGLCAAAAGVGGHMATRLLFAVERVIEARIEGLK